MNRRSLLTVVLALVLLVSGCSAGTVATSEQAGSQATGEWSRQARPAGTAGLPQADLPLYGHWSRQARPAERWRVSGYVPKPVTRKPYTNRLLSEHMLPAPVDAHGVRIFERLGKRYYHPVAIAQYALAQLDRARRTGNDKAMAAALTNAKALLAGGKAHRGGLYFPYPFDFPLGGNKKQTIHAPWWSAMAQGQALTLFVRLYRSTGDQVWRDAADKTFATLDDLGPTKAGPWAAYVDTNGYYWFEEYAGNTLPLLVLNGHMFATFGVWEYYRLTHSARAKELFDAGTTTLREYLPLFRVKGEAAYYCLRAPLCQRPSWQDEKYHLIVVKQMRIIADMTDDPWFAREARRYLADFSG